jgi:hypothetical protein
MSKRKMYICRQYYLREGTSDAPPDFADGCSSIQSTMCAHMKPHRFNESGSCTPCSGWCSGVPMKRDGRRNACIVIKKEDE